MKPALKMEKPVYGGDCLAHGPDGKAVFVPLTLPGETVSVRVIEEKKSFAKAEVESIEDASPDRVEPLCRHFGVCGGCHFQHAGYPAQLAMKQQILRETLERARVAAPSEIAVLAGEPWGYRNRIRLAVTEGEIGYRARRSHDLVAVAECPIAAPELLRVAQEVGQFLRKVPAPAAIAEMELFESGDGSKILVTLLCESRSDANRWPGWVQHLRAAIPGAVSGVGVQLENGSLTPATLAVAGETSLVYKATGFSYRVDHRAFFQVNRWLVDEFVALVTEGRAGKVAWDLFAGVGLFARRLAQRFDEVIAVESAPASTEALRQNLSGTGGRAVAATTLEFLRRNREERAGRPDFLVVDPPRAGLGEETTRLLNAIGSPEMVYVSCDPATLARDLKALTGERYRIERLTLVDMFPQTFHMETVVHLIRT